MYNEDEWTRGRHGRRFSFFACEEEITDVMNSALPGEYAPYSLIATYLEKERHGKKYVEKHIVGGMDELSRLRSHTWKFFIHSTVITPDLRTCVESRFSACLSLSGLVCLQHGLVRRGKSEETDITFVNKVENIQSGAVVEHVEYGRIYSAFKRAIQKRLVFGTKKRMPDGTIKESTTLRMTELFAQRCKSGEIAAAADVGSRL